MPAELQFEPPLQDGRCLGHVRVVRGVEQVVIAQPLGIDQEVEGDIDDYQPGGTAKPKRRTSDASVHSRPKLWGRLVQ